MVKPVRVSYMDQIELFDDFLKIIIIIGYLKPYSCVKITTIKRGILNK